MTKNNPSSVLIAIIMLLSLSGCICCPLLEEEQKIQAIQDLADSKEILRTSLANRGITSFEVFASPEKIVVEYEGNASTDERTELAYVLASAAIAFPYTEEVDAHRFIDTNPRAKASTPTLAALQAVSGELEYNTFTSNNITYSTLQKEDTFLPNLLEETLNQTAENIGD